MMIPSEEKDVRRPARRASFLYGRANKEARTFTPRFPPYPERRALPARKEAFPIRNPAQNPPSAPALARSLAPGALSRVGRIVMDDATDPKVVLTAARLILWAAGMDDPPDDSDDELSFTLSPEASDAFAQYPV